MLKTIFFSAIILLSYSAIAQNKAYSLATSTSVKHSDLKSNFSSPPGESRLRCYWWWLNSMATKESITRDLEEMKAKGYGGASLVDAGSSSYDIASKTQAGSVFMSPQWMELYQHAVKEAERLGIELSVNVQSGWNPGAPSITPEYALKKLVYTETNAVGGQMLHLELPQPETNLMYQDILVQAIPQQSPNSPIKDDAILNWSKKTFNKAMGWQGIYPLYELREGFDNQAQVPVLKKSEILDVTRFFDGKTLQWNAPAGKWTIIRYGYTCTGAVTSTTSDGWNGLSVDHLNPEAFQLFANTVIQPLVDAAKQAGNSVKFLQTDSWEMGMVNWTNHFPEEFRRLRGYDLNSYFPVMTGRVVESQDISNRFLHDLRKTVGDCVAENHYQLFYNLAHNNGMGIHPESGGPHSAPVDALRVMSISDFPQGEFWAMSNTHRVSDAARLAVKQSACVAHTNGKRFVAAEGPTSIGPQWERSPKDLKSNIDRVFCSGINRIVWHTFTSSPKEFGLPGNEYFAGTHLNPNITWWNHAGDFISYLNRCSYMLQQGLYVADVLYYYGDDVPNFVFLREEYPDLNLGYDWDKCSKDVILNRLSFDGEKIILPDGMSYRLLVLSPEKAIDLSVLKKIAQMVEQGLTLIAPRPEEATGLSDYPVCDQELKALAEKLWGKIDGKTITENHFGKGRVIWGQNINDILAEMKIKPDFEFTGTHPKTAIDYIHRTTNEQEIYFVANRFSQMKYNDFEYRYLPELPDRYEQVECRFRVTGKVPELWDPMTGETTEIICYREETGQTIIPLHFEPDGSKFIVFRKGKQTPHITQITRNKNAIFPNYTGKATTFPTIDFQQIEKTKSANLYEDGEYQLTWSNGKTEVLKTNRTSDEIPLSKNWVLHFDPQWKAPAQIQINKLKSWTEFSDINIKYYSGTAIYTQSFNLSDKDRKANKLLLDLGNVQEMASVKINGHQLPTRWCAPFLFDITQLVRSGKNDLEVEVVNMWANRLIGDGQLAENDRLTKTNIKKFNAPDAEKYLRVSGLLGPVYIKKVHQIDLR